MFIRFFTRRDFGGWRKFIWYPIQIIQGKYVHCDIVVDGVVLNADNRRGVICKPDIEFSPKTLIYVKHNPTIYRYESNRILGQKYSWENFFRLLFPKWGDDPKGMICSELVAHMISTCAVDTRYQIPFIATPPYRWTPNAVYQALVRLDKYINN